MQVYLKVRFTTAEPISQTDGMKMWQMGTHFVAVGARQYQLTTNGDSVSVMSAAESVIADIVVTLGREIFVTQVDSWTNELPETATTFVAAQRKDENA